jgi:hypothetical protein
MVSAAGIPAPVVERREAPAAPADAKMVTRNVNLWYGE